MLINRSGVTLMELLLVVAVLAVLAPITVPVVSSYSSVSKDMAVTHQVIDMVSHTRSMGLMGRKAEALITFENASSAFEIGGSKNNLPDGFTLGNFKVNGVNTANMSVAFDISGNIVCNGGVAASASVDLMHSGVKISTVYMNGIGIPVPEMTASVDPANPSGSGPGGRCGWR